MEAVELTAEPTVKVRLPRRITKKTTLKDATPHTTTKARRSIVKKAVTTKANKRQANKEDLEGGKPARTARHASRKQSLIKRAGAKTKLKKKALRKLKEKHTSIKPSEGSIFNVASFASFEQASADEKVQWPHVLASFFKWMTEGPTPKSARNYTDQVKTCLGIHGKSLAAVASDDYVNQVKATQENKKRNQIIGAGIKKFAVWLSERGSSTGPWEVLASADDTTFQVNVLRIKARASRGQVAGKGSLKALFGVKRTSPETSSEQADDAKKDNDDGHDSKNKAKSRTLRKKGEKDKLKTNEAKAAEQDCNKTLTAVASTTSDSSSPKVAKVPAMFQRTTSNAASSAQDSAMSVDSTQPSEQSPAQAFFGAKNTIQGFFGSKTSASTSKDEELKSPEPHLNPCSLKDTPEKVSSTVDKQLPDPTEEQLNELLPLREAVNKAAKARDYKEAAHNFDLLSKRCKELGCSVPSKFQKAGKTSVVAAQGSVQGEDSAEPEPIDSLTFARGILEATFPLKNPSIDSEEDDNEILQDEKRKISRRTDKDIGEEDQDEEDEDEKQECKAKKEALSKIEDAPYEDIDRFPSVSATFRAWLAKRKGSQEDEIEAYLKVFHDLFAQDEKSLSSMAKVPYLKVVGDDPTAKSVVNLFTKFWSASKNGPFIASLPRAERGFEVKLRATYGIPRQWVLRAVQRSRKEDLIILTGPEDEKHYVEISKLAQLPLLQSQPFQDELRRRKEMTELERQEELHQAESRAKATAEKREKLLKDKAELQDSIRQLTGGQSDDQVNARKVVLSAMFRQQLICSRCARTSTSLSDVLMEEVSVSKSDTRWLSYEDVPNATEKEIEQYPLVLATFYQQGYPYMTGVRKLMELHKKRPIDMATDDFKRLVCKDPENARCNGYLNSAILYLMKFREAGGFDNLVDLSSYDARKIEIFTPDLNREAGMDQESFDDLQVDLPLEVIMADATNSWQSELQEKLDEDGYIQEDIDARGHRPVALSISLLPNATDEEWRVWPNILAKYETEMRKSSDEAKLLKRDIEAAELLTTMKELIEEHSKGPEATASRKYVKMIRSTYANSIKERAVTKFADFWAAHKDHEFPAPKLHSLASKQYALIDRTRVEQAKQLSASWQLPDGWAVKLGKDGVVLKVTGPSKSDVYRSKEEALAAIASKVKRQNEAAANDIKVAVSSKEQKTTLQQRLRDAVQQENYELAQSLSDEIQADDAAVVEDSLARQNRRGSMPIVPKEAFDRPAKGSGKRQAAKRTAPAEDLNQNPAKARKASSLHVQQQKEVANCELTLRAGQWKVLGIRSSSGAVIPLDDSETQAMPRESAVVVLIFLDEDVRERKKRQIIESWGLDDSWTVSIRVRRSGDQVTVRRSDGKAFFTRHEVNCEKDREARRRLQPELVSRLEVLEKALAADQAWEFDVKESAQLSGYYIRSSNGDSFEKVCCLSIALDGLCQVSVQRASDGWSFMDPSSNTTLAVAKPSAIKSPFESTSLELYEVGTTTRIAVNPRSCLVATEMLEQRFAESLAKPLGSCCRLCQSANSECIVRCVQEPTTQVAKVTRAQKLEMYEMRLKELEERRALAPRTLPDIIGQMLKKLGNIFDDQQLPAVLFQKKTLRIGTMCSGTDAPILVARGLQRALSSLSSELSFEHVFSVEYDASKQEFLKANFPDCPRLFQDVTQMGRKRAFDVLSGQPQDVPGNLDILVAGFSCKDLSMMNSYKKTLMEMGTSGLTLKGVLDYAERYRPRLILLENVWAIAKANSCGFRQVDLVIEGLKARGYAAGYRLLNSCDYFLPQIRHRIWMWAIRIDVDGKLQNLIADPAEIVAMSEKATVAVASKFNKILLGLEEPCALHFEDYMLDDDHPDVRAYIQSMKAKQRRNVRTKKKGAKRDWTEKYDSHRTGHDYQYERPYTAVRDAEFLQLLNDREKELLDLKCLDVLNEQGKDPRTVPMLWELTQSVERVPGTRVRRDRQNYATCILPGMLWHSSRHRWVLGVEKLALQGIFAEDLLDTNFSQRLLGDLAGNAFTTTVCAANLIAALICGEDIRLTNFK